ncbi:hypothetical protein AAD018_017085 [Aestuariibius insulae]|uniref:hypothetical protein n=1 Tax=Aestuariibius insulae TaxID=2058287 RepID=UPI00345E081A
MNKILRYCAFGGLLSADLALACQPDPDFAYDEVASQDISIAIASVVDVEIVGTDASCWLVEYEKAEYLFGLGDQAFSVATCADEFFQIEALTYEAEGLEYLGFVPGADVLLGLVKAGEDAKDLRYAVPSCWGPLHFNLDKLSDEERTALLQNIQTQIEGAR